ncbi:MAG TPA: Mfa1 fimbrilin C-terminal domain-containing protein [Candidatus Parabacteroides intestinipullorum]|uniref:Mfa1 fimbrilin C-terminal domain-containing protein n=1 Tax=Candidatus Parabacteroides intestinipullorum TaxID=2838723 RepID=A0A9D1XB86_9BACT|nr:Mfa1 fimbrilin C-terminal domain-containing protein [Candidatus Parabacteroides intestinipullorum]
MNLKSTLWTLAFAVAAVSCSDELEEGGGTGTGNEENGEGVYVTVNVSSNVGPTTKAGEEGGGDLEDSDVESAVNNVNIFLIPSTKTTKMISNDLSIVNGAAETPIASGYTTDLLPATGSIEHHDAVATVKLSVPELDAWYHVVTVANAGKLGFTTLGQLRDYLQTTAWSGTNKYDEDGNGARNFVMTTHQMYQSDAGGSDLYVTAANSDPNHPAETTAYVERLAARIDMRFVSDLVGEKGASLTGNANMNDKVWITGYQVINQLVGGTYLLKRVTGNTASVTGSIESTDANKHPSPYLADEIWGNGNFNYVLDPWTRKKTYTAPGDDEDPTNFPTEINNSGAYYTGSNGSYTQTPVNTASINLAYTEKTGGLYLNHFHEGMNTEDFMKGFSSPVVDIKDISTTDNEYTPILYTQENTMDVEQQKNGFSTGVIFEAEYAPEHVSQYEETNGSVSSEVDYKKGSSFLVADYGRTGTTETGSGASSTITPLRKLSADMRTIAALGLKAGSDATIVKAMFNENGDWSSISKQADVEKVVTDMSGGPLVVAFKLYLQGKLEGISESNTFEKVKNYLTWDEFVKASHDAGNGIKYVPSDDDLANGIKASDGVEEKTATEVREDLMNNYNIAYYAAGTNGGKNYLKYWIKHEPNGTDNDPMGVMEFAIVRNNVYQLSVTGIRDLGDPLPFTPGKDDPDTPDKTKDIYIVIKLYVKEWVKRYNSDIIL